MRVGRQTGFVESSLSSDEEEEVAQGSEERNGQGDEDNEGDEAQKLPRQGLVHLQPAVADLLVRFLHCTSGKEKLLGSAKNSFSWTVKKTLPKAQWTLGKLSKATWGILPKNSQQKGGYLPP